MANTYKSVKTVEIGAGGGSGGTPVYERTFTNSTWQASGSEWEIVVLESAHNLGQNIIVQVEQLVGSEYEVVDIYVKNESGDITIIVGNNSRFDGRVLIKGQ